MAAIARAAPDERKEMVENLRKPKAAARGQPFPEVPDSDEDDQDEDLEEDSEEETVPYMIEMRATNENGEISFTADLPVDGKYFIREVSAPRGYVTSEEKRDSPVINDEVTAFIIACLQEDQETSFKKQRHTAKRIYDRLVEERGFTGGESTIRRKVREIRAGLPKAFIPFAYMDNT